MNEYRPIPEPDPERDSSSGSLIERQALEWQQAELAAKLLAINPFGLRGIHLRGPNSPAITYWTEHVHLLLGERPKVGVTHTTAVSRLTSQIDIVATLAAGKPVSQPGLRDKLKDGLMIIQQASQVPAALSTELARLLDRDPSIAVVALNEADPDEAGLAPLLEDRLGLAIQLSGQCLQTWSTPLEPASKLKAAKKRLNFVDVSENDYRVASDLALAYGIASLRAPFFTLEAARANAALEGRNSISEEDFAVAAMFTILPRATRLPTPAGQEDQTEPDRQQPEEQSDQQTQSQEQQSLSVDEIVEAAQAMFAEELAPAVSRNASTNREAGRRNTGSKSKRLSHGRPIGVRRGRREEIRQLSMRDTLIAAVAKQGLRTGLATGAPPSAANPNRLQVWVDDFRVLRRSAPQRVTTIFMVDASGSHAVGRLSEAKGAALAMLQTCYERRDRVAVISFGGEAAEVALAPTPAPARAARELNLMPSGGGTPLASALVLAQSVARQVEKDGDTPFLVLLTDGKANIALNGQPGRAEAAADVKKISTAIAAQGTDCFFIDTGRRSSETCKAIAQDLRGRYLHLHRIPPAVLHAELQSAARGTIATAGAAF